MSNNSLANIVKLLDIQRDLKALPPRLIPPIDLEKMLGTLEMAKRSCYEEIGREVVDGKKDFP